jgi:hypothetical protein
MKRTKGMWIPETSMQEPGWNATADAAARQQALQEPGADQFNTATSPRSTGNNRLSDEVLLANFAVSDVAYCRSNMQRHVVLVHPDPNVEATLSLTRNTCPPALRADLNALVMNAPVDKRTKQVIYAHSMANKARPGFNKKHLVLERGVFKLMGKICVRGGYGASFTNPEAQPYKFKGSTPVSYDWDATAEGIKDPMRPYLHLAIRRLNVLVDFVFANENVPPIPSTSISTSTSTSSSNSSFDSSSPIAQPNGLAARRRIYDLCLVNRMQYEIPDNEVEWLGKKYTGNTLGQHRDDETTLVAGTIPCYVGGERNPSRVKIEFNPDPKYCRKMGLTPCLGVPLNTVTPSIQNGFIKHPTTRQQEVTAAGSPDFGAVAGQITLKSIELLLQPGDVYAMEGQDFQRMFVHGVPDPSHKENTESGARFSYTWRVMMDHAGIQAKREEEEDDKKKLNLKKKRGPKKETNTVVAREVISATALSPVPSLRKTRFFPPESSEQKREQDEAANTMFEQTGTAQRNKIRRREERRQENR